MYKGRTYFRATKGDHALSFFSFLFFLVLALASFKQEGFGWMTIVWVLATLLGIGGVIETYTSSILLGKHNLIMRKTFRKIVIKRRDILSISQEKGCDTIIILKNGDKIPLAQIGSTGTQNSIKAWLKASK